MTSRGRGDRCAIGACDTRLATGYLMCARHWRLVSKPTQYRVYRAIAAYRNSGGKDATLAELAAAQAEAIREAQGALEVVTHA